MIPENITLPKIVSREECKKLLKEEKNSPGSTMISMLNGGGWRIRVF